MGEDDAHWISPDDRSFLGSLSDAMAGMEQNQNEYDEAVKVQAEMFVDRMSRWTPEMRLGAALACTDLMETWDGAVALLAQMGGCGDPTCDTCSDPDGVDSAILKTVSLWLTVSARLKSFADATVTYGPELMNLSQALHDLGFGKHDD